MEVNRKNIWLMWLMLSVISSAVASIFSMAYWELTYMSEPNVDWSPINDTVGMFMIMPFGWLISIATPAGWLNLAGLGVAIYKVSYKPLIISAIGSALFGVFWPKYFVGIMGI